MQRGPDVGMARAPMQHVPRTSLLPELQGEQTLTVNVHVTWLLK